jgi:hypothetical protein
MIEPGVAECFPVDHDVACVRRMGERDTRQRATLLIRVGICEAKRCQTRQPLLTELMVLRWNQSSVL